MDRRFREGAAEVAKAGLAFDAWLYQTQLGELLDFARALPDLRIVVDHPGPVVHRHLWSRPVHVRVELSSRSSIDQLIYQILWACFDRLAERLEPGERHSLFAGTARRVYRLREVRRSYSRVSP